MGLDFSSERYVRVYVRDTADWLALSWDAQALLMQLLRKADRSGVVSLGRHGKRSVAALVQQVALWESRISPALEELLADGCLVHEGEDLVFPNYTEAQEAKASGAMRSADYRARKSTKTKISDAPSRISDEVSPVRDDLRSLVTPRDSMPSRAVLAVPSQTKDLSAEPTIPVLAPLKLEPPSDQPLLPIGKSDAERVFEHWCKAWKKNAKTAFDADRRKAVEDRLAGRFKGKPSRVFTVTELCQCIDGYRLSPHHRGENSGGTVYDDLALFCSSDKRVEAGIKFAESPPIAVAPKPAGFAAAPAPTSAPGVADTQRRAAELDAKRAQLEAERRAKEQHATP